MDPAINYQPIPVAVGWEGKLGAPGKLEAWAVVRMNFEQLTKIFRLTFNCIILGRYIFIWRSTQIRVLGLSITEENYGSAFHM